MTKTASYAACLAAPLALALSALASAPAAADAIDEAAHQVAEEIDGDDAFLEHLYEPEFVMEQAQQIGLSQEQREALINRVVETRAAVTRIEFEAIGARERLFTLLQANTIDAAAVLPVAEQLLAVESETKKLYLALLIELHNDLSPGQRQRLDAMRGHDDEEEQDL